MPGVDTGQGGIDIGRKEFPTSLTFVACSRVCHLCDLLFVSPFPFQQLVNMKKSQIQKDRQQEDALVDQIFVKKTQVGRP